MRRDWWICAAVLILAVFGVLLQVRLAGSVPALQGLAPLLAGLLGGVAAAVACGGGRAERFLTGKGKWIAFGVAVALMVALLVFGRRYRGGLYLPGRINPSELVKLCLAAILSGGLTGAGFGLGEVQAVPIVASDFVYAAVAEELGFAGCVTIVALWAFVFARGILAAARRAADAPAEALLATGIVASLAVQLVLNVAGVLNALPMTGITLPLISLGGSSQATVLVMCGVLIGVSGARHG